jgi:hypothetical protein
MSKFYTLANVYNEPPKKKWWEKIFRPKEKWEFNPVLLPDRDECPPYVGIFYSGDLNKAKIERIKGECIRGHIDSSQLKLGSKYNIVYGDPIVVRDMVYMGRKDTFYFIEKSSVVGIFYIFSSLWDLNGKHVEVCVGANASAKISEVI